MTCSSVRGLYVQVPVEGALEYPRGWLDLGLGRLEDGVPGGCGPGRERLAEVAVTGVFGGGHQALPVGQLFGEYVVLGGQVGDPLDRFLGLLPRGQGELVALVLGEGLGFGRAQGRVVLAGVAARSSASAATARCRWWRVAVSQSARSAMTAAKTSSRWR